MNLNIWRFGAHWYLGTHLCLHHLGCFLWGRDFLLHFISFDLSFGNLICWGYFGNFGKNPSCIIKLTCVINSWNWEKMVKFMELGNSLIKWRNWIIWIICLLNCWHSYFRFRNNCFGLSVEDSRDCCRHCMWIRNNWN